MRILIVEDDDVLRDGLVVGLSLAGFTSEAVATRAEGEAALDAAGIPWTSEEEFRGDRGGLAQTSRKDAGASSTWQSLARGAGSTEVDYLNGEIVLLGRLHGVATPANELVQRIVNQLTLAGAQPGALAPTELLGMIRAA